MFKMKIQSILSGLKPLNKNGSHYMEQRSQEGPARPLSNSFGNVITSFPSYKNGHTVRAESLLELQCMMAMEISYIITGFLEQPPTVMLKRPNAKGYEYTRPYTPDLVCKLINGVHVGIEVKPRKAIEEDLKKPYPRFKLENSGRYTDQIAAEYFESIGVHFLVITEDDFGPHFFGNASLLATYLTVGCPSEATTMLIMEAITEMGILTLEQLASQIEANLDETECLDRELMLECVNWLLVHGKLYGNVEDTSIKDISKFEVYLTQGIARSRVWDKQLPGTIKAKTTELVLGPGKTFALFKRPYAYVTQIADKVHLKNENGVIEEYSHTSLCEQFQKGSLTVDDGGQSNHITPFAKADSTRQNEAIRRAEALVHHEHGISLLPKSTYHLWSKMQREGRLLYGCGLSGLVPEIRPGNRTAKTCPYAKDLAREYIQVSYLGLPEPKDSKWDLVPSATREAKNKAAAWADYKKAAVRNGVIYVSYETFTRAINRIRKVVKERQKAGRKAAYQVSDTLNGNWSGATTGQFSGHIVEIDHTRVDLESLDDDDELGLGRLWLTVAIDTYSRMILGYYLGFGAPSKVSLMMTLRDIVRRNGYLPVCVSVDGGKEFGSIYFEMLVAQFRMHKRTRPPARPRCGNIVERWFGTSNIDFWHNLLGNTKLMVNPRNTSSEFIAKNRAIWGVREVRSAFDRYIDKYNTKLVHSSIETTPAEFHDASFAQLLPQEKRIVRYDKSFEICTMLAPDGGTELSCYRYGLHCNNGKYSHPILRKELSQNTRFQVKWDPWDMRHIYFSHAGEWHEALLDGSNEYEALSYAEVEILSNEKRVKGTAKKKKALSLKRLFARADTLTELKDQELQIASRRSKANREEAASKQLKTVAENSSSQAEIEEYDYDHLPEELISTSLLED